MGSAFYERTYVTACKKEGFRKLGNYRCFETLINMTLPPYIHQPAADTIAETFYLS